MRIGVIGVGNIAEKAYLPTYAKNQGKIDFYFATRNKETKKRIHEMYGFDHLYESIDELLSQDIKACMIHAATKVHYELAKNVLKIRCMCISINHSVLTLMKSTNYKNWQIKIKLS